MNIIPRWQKFKCPKCGITKIKSVGCIDLFCRCQLCGSLMGSAKMNWLEKMIYKKFKF